MRENSHFLCQHFLQLAQMRRLPVLLYQCVYLSHFFERENWRQFFGIGIGKFHPELIKLIWRCAFRIEPYIAAFRLTKFTAITFGDQWTDQCKSLTPTLATYKFGTSNNIAPLIGTTH